MKKETFTYNHHTLTFDKIERTWKDKLLRAFGFTCAVLLAGFVMTLITHQFFPSPREKALLREIDQMAFQYESMNNDIEMMGKVLDNIQERDAAAHRMVFGMDPIDNDVWNGGIGGHPRNADFSIYKHSGELLSTTKSKIDKLKRQLSIQSESLDTILSLAENREDMFSSIPSIEPVRSDKLARKIRYLSGYGMRIHPIHKVRKMHAGIDFTAPKGTPIQSTGDGVVVRVEKKRTGYGKNVVIDHGYGYKTLYGHMSKIEVKKGQKIKKGQQIGLVGSTGSSTAPHCHYEVHFKGKKVNPIHYCMSGLSPEEYQELVEASDKANQSFD